MYSESVSRREPGDLAGDFRVSDHDPQVRVRVKVKGKGKGRGRGGSYS